MKEHLGQIEAIIFASGEPVGIDRIAQVLALRSSDVELFIEELKQKYNTTSSGVQIITLENEVQMTTNPDYIEPIRAVLDLKRNTPLSQAALEVLAIVAYNQPVTKAFVEQVRGVDCSGVIGSLIQKELLEERGRLELPGRPLLYGTTSNFLRCMNLLSISDLPMPPTIKDKTDEENQKPEEIQMTFLEDANIAN